GTPGQYFRGLVCAELAARRTQHGRYKWLAHRAFWRGRDHLLALRGGTNMNEVYTALAYLHADDSIQEQACPVGVTLRQRQWRDLSPVETRQPPFNGRWFFFQPKLTPSKLIFRAGMSPTDACLVMQAGQRGGHGHMDAGAITYYGDEHAL